VTPKPKNAHTAAEHSKYNKSQKHRVEKAKGLPHAERLFQIFSLLLSQETLRKNPASKTLSAPTLKWKTSANRKTAVTALMFLTRTFN